jgi:putative ABC transport system permease protein
VSLLELLRLAFSRLATSRLRSALTMLGVIIGVASVVALVGIGQGTSSNITARLSGLGTNLLTVTPGATRSGNTRGAQGSATTLTIADASSIRTLDHVAAVAPELSGQALVTSGTANTTTTIVGTTPDYVTVRAYDVAAGSFLSNLDVEKQLRVVVLGATTATDLGVSASSVGSTVQIGGLPFEIKGILAAKGTGTFQNQDDQVIVPVTVVQKYFVGTKSVRTIGVSVASQDSMDLVTAEMTSLLRERHGLATTATDDFSIANQAQLLETASSISATLTLLLGGIASISLIVGGIGIMNIMLVSVRGDRRTAPRHPCPVPSRSADAVAPRWARRRRGRPRDLGCAVASRRPGHRPQPTDSWRRGGIQRPHRRPVRRLAGSAGGRPRPHRRAPVRIERNQSIP